MSADRPVWCAALEKLAQLCSWGSNTWQLSQKETYCHCQLKSTTDSVMRTQGNTFGTILQCRHNITSPLTFHLQRSPIFHQKSDWCCLRNLWRRFRCFGYVICHFCTSSFAIDCGLASYSLLQCFVNFCGFKISLKERNIHLGTTHARLCLSVFQFYNTVSFLN